MRGLTSDPMLRRRSIGLLASAVAITPLPLKAQDISAHVYASYFPGSTYNFFSSSWNEAKSEREYFFTKGGCRVRCEKSLSDQSWTEVVPRVKEFESGALYFPKQTLANGAQIGGTYMCKLSTVQSMRPTPRWAVCTKDGWAIGEEGASPVFLGS